MEQVDPRTSLVNALITLGVVAVLAFVGFVIRLSKGETIRSPLFDEKDAIVLDERENGNVGRILSELEQGRRPKESGVRVVNRQLVHATAGNSLLMRQEMERFEVLVGCELLAGRESTASRLWLANQGREFVGRLYFAEAFAPRGGSGVAGDIGTEAMKVVEDLLESRTTRLFTRWQPVEGEAEGHYYVMIYVEGIGGADRRFLSEILVANGLADFRAWDMVLPDGRTHSSEFVRRLVSLQQVARAGRRGAWSLQTVAR